MAGAALVGAAVTEAATALLGSLADARAERRAQAALAQQLAALVARAVAEPSSSLEFLPKAKARRSPCADASLWSHGSSVLLPPMIHSLPPMIHILPVPAAIEQMFTVTLSPRASTKACLAREAAGMGADWISVPQGVDAKHEAASVSPAGAALAGAPEAHVEHGGGRCPCCEAMAVWERAEEQLWGALAQRG